MAIATSFAITGKFWKADFVTARRSKISLKAGCIRKRYRSFAAKNRTLSSRTDAIAICLAVGHVRVRCITFLRKEHVVWLDTEVVKSRSGRFALFCSAP